MGAIYTDTVFPKASGNYTALAIPLGGAECDLSPMRYILSLSEHRKKRKLTQSALAELMGVEQPTVQRWERGTRTPDVNQIIALAGALGVAPGDLFKSPNVLPVGPQLFIKGAVAAGVWREAFEWPEEDWQIFHGRPDVTASAEMRFGLRVEGDSMNEVYPHGTIVECVSLMGGAELLPGKRIIVVRKRNGNEFEATVKEFYVDPDGNQWAVPRSTNPTFRPIALTEPEEGVEETRVAAIVVGSYRPE